MEQKIKSTVHKAFLASLPVMAGYLVLGTAYGILMEDSGYGFLWSFAMSLTVYAGSMQFAAVNLLTGGATLVSAAIMTFLVNARHIFYGISMLGTYKNTGREKPYLIFSLTDETYAIVCGGAPEGVDRKKYFLLVSLFDQCYWVAGSVIGGLVGSAIPFQTNGIDFAMTALFLVIFTDQCLKSKDHVPAVTGVAATLVCLVIFGSKSFLIPSMLIISAVLIGIGIIRERRSGK